jgi:hypothetical protein
LKTAGKTGGFEFIPAKRPKNLAGRRGSVIFTAW